MNEAIVDIAVALVADAVPEIIADAIDGLAENSEDRVIRTVATILSTYVRDNGEEALEEVADLLIDTLRAKRDSAEKLYELYQAGVEVTDLTSELQGIEASRRERAIVLTTIVAGLFRNFGRAAREAVIHAARN